MESRQKYPSDLTDRQWQVIRRWKFVDVYSIDESGVPEHAATNNNFKLTRGPVNVLEDGFVCCFVPFVGIFGTFFRVP